MVLGFHFIFSAYGFWLPNDPRGSWSDVIRQFDLLQFGPPTKVNTTHSVAHQPHDHDQRLAAKAALKYPPVRFTGHQALAVANGFAHAADEHHYRVHALAIMPDHAHLVMARHDRHIDTIAAHLKAKATAQLSCEKLNPMDRFASPAGRKPSPWGRNYWCPFIDTNEQMLAAIKYVEDNPPKAGLPPQHWNAIVPYAAY